jgi:predicted ribosome quality control (RQC) complex YloA/Tae2 family protein
LEKFIKSHLLESQEVIKKSLPKQPVPQKPYHQFVSKSGLHIWVGKNAKCNDLLSFHYANGNDWWLHAHNFPGSHVVIRLVGDKEPDQEALADAAELALRYSKAKEGQEGEVSVTQAKYLRPVKGTPGKVMLSRHTVLYHRLDEKRWLRLYRK